ncbi:beta-lactamase family protein [Saprospiraceae bacterium]|nr:beta-lactamase family protein [Saprospiraceae bacterium]
MLNKILKLIGIIILLLFVIAVFNYEKINKLRKVVSLFEKENIVENFLHMEDINETSNLIKSPSPTQLPVNLTHQLPIDFSSNGKTINVQDFIDHSMTTGLMIIHKDTIILENYTRGLTPETTHISWSMAKSFISGMIGIAIEEGKIKSIQDQITDYLPQFKGTGYEGVTIKNALEMSSGVGFNEDYSDFNSDINRFGRYFALGQSFEKFALSLKNTRKPGTFNHYVSIDTQVLGMVLKKATGKSITQFMQNKIWNPIGMEDDAQWIIDEDGMELALGGLNATLRDYGKYGLLYLHEGNWFGNQIISQNWVKQSITMDGPHLQPGINQFSSNDLGYGLQWWIPQEADGAFLASGIYNQHIYIQPNRDLVIVKLSGNYHFKTNKDLEKSQHIDFFKSIVEQFPKNIIANKTVE